MTVEEKKERNRKYGAICARAKAMGIMQGDAISAIMDIESADRKFNLRSVINGWCKSQSRGEYKRVYQSNEINAYANEACYQRI